MSSSTVKAQQLANEANVAMTHETNETNRAIASEANDWNYRMFQEQNAWNRQQWNLENEYNSPAQQMQRYLEAGINPLWAIGNGDPGRAQQLTSASVSPANVSTMVAPQVQPEADPTKMSNIVAAANNVVNSLQGFTKLALEQQDVNIRDRAQRSTEALNLAEGMFKRSQTAGQNILNNLNSDTYSYQANIKAAEYHRLLGEIDNLKKQGKNIDAVTLNLEATRDQINAQTDYIYEQKRALIQNIAQGWRKLSIEQQNANTSAFSAQSQSYYQGEDLKQRYREYTFDKAKTEQELKLKSNEQLLQLYQAQSGWIGKTLGSAGDLVHEALGSELPARIQEAFDTISMIGTVLKSRVIGDPSQENIRSFNEWQRSVQSLPLPPSAPSTGNLQNFNVLNP